MRPLLRKALEAIVDICLDQKKKIAALKRSNAMLEKRLVLLTNLLRDIEQTMDTGDQQQIAVGIKRWRHEIERENLLESKIQPGLVRE